MALEVDTHAVDTYAESCRTVGAEVQADCQVDPSVVAAMESGYGPVGAAFTAAFGEFQTALQAAGAHVASRYERHADDLRDASQRYTTSDQDGAQRVGAVEATPVGAFDGPGGYADPNWGDFTEGSIQPLPTGPAGAGPGPSVSGGLAPVRIT
ncbi:type VII secretion target [Mycobacterium sp. NPDC003323]